MVLSVVTPIIQNGLYLNEGFLKETLCRHICSSYVLRDCQPCYNELRRKGKSKESRYVGGGAPRINHLFFADDSPVLMRARAEDARELKWLLDIYERHLVRW
jgi:hypothetical protein